MRHVALPFVAFFAATVLTGCVETEDYAYCAFDPCLYYQCSDQGLGEGEGGTTEYTCATPKHPHCDAGVCLVFRGSGPFCTQVCDPANGGSDCPAGGTCEEYREDVFYCVPPEAERPAPPEDPGTCSDPGIVGQS